MIRAAAGWRWRWGTQGRRLAVRSGHPFAGVVAVRARELARRPMVLVAFALQAVALLFPPTYVFEAARSGLSSPEIEWTYVGIAAAENVVYFGLSVWFFSYMYRRSRQTGQFARNEE